MSKLQATLRNQELKVKQLKQKGLIPGNLYGKDINGSMQLQIHRSDVNLLLRNKSKGSKITLSINGEEVDAILREVSYNPAIRQVEHLAFQKISVSDLITTTAPIILTNKDKIPVSNIHQVVFEIPYRAMPSKLVEIIEIDLDGMTAGDCIKVKDLVMAKDSDIEILTGLDNLVLSITETKGRLNTFTS